MPQSCRFSRSVRAGLGQKKEAVCGLKAVRGNCGDLVGGRREEDLEIRQFSLCFCAQMSEAKGRCEKNK